MDFTIFPHKALGIALKYYNLKQKMIVLQNFLWKQTAPQTISKKI